jgi:TPR repeat protein
MRILTIILSLVCLSAFAEITPEEINRLKLNAEKGDSAAQTFLGYCYNFGKGVQKDNVEAIKWYRKSAEQGNSLAQFYLGAYYHDAKGASKNDVEAVKWFRKSAEQGYASAQFWLGMYYLYNGVEGVFKENPVEGVMWLRKSAEQGEAMAQFVLGGCYHLGKGVQKDIVEAIKCYRKSAEQGNVSALIILAGLYNEGEGLNKDPVEAYAYYNLVGLVAVSEAQPAEVKAKSLAERHRKELEGELTPSQIEAGQKRSKEMLALILVQREAKEESKALIHPGKSSKERQWWELIDSQDIYIYIIGLILVLGIIITNVEKEKRLNTFIGFLFILLLGILIYFDVLDGDEVMSVIRALHFVSK